MPYSAEELAKYEAFVTSLEEATETAKGKLKNLGTTDTGLNVYRIDINPSAKRTVFIGATIHGNEPSGALGVVEYLKQHPIPADTRLIVLPLINPHGFLKDSRYTEGRHDLNRSFRAKAPPVETQMVKDTLTGEKIDYLLSLHEDSDSDDFYVYLPEAVTPASVRPLLKVAGKHFPVKPDGKYRDETVVGGTISFSDKDRVSHNLKSFEFWVRSSFGCPYVCTEVPTKFELATRVKCVQRAVRWCIERHFPKFQKKK